MDWTNVKDVLAKVAPTIGAAVGGPLGGAAGAILGQVLGVQDTNDAGSVTAAIAGATPDQLLALKKADQDFQARMAELGFANAKDIEALVVDDRKDARGREVAIRDKTPSILAALIILTYISVQVILLFFSVHAEMREIVMRSLGTLDAAVGLVLGYYFGSSLSSKTKDEAIKASIQAAKL